MLLWIAGVLVVLWAVGFFAAHVAGGLIHIVIGLAVIAVIAHFVRGRGARA
jgi:hypothetical protein